jgi:hypothetical protein
MNANEIFCGTQKHVGGKMDQGGEKGLIFWVGVGCGIFLSVSTWFVYNFVRIEL